MLTGLFALPVINSFKAAEFSASFKDEPNALLNENNHNWDEEIDDEEGWVITRIYNNTSFAPKLNQAFSAPNGYAFYLTIDDATLDRIGDEIRQVPELETDIFSVFFGYTFLGNKVEDISPVQFNSSQIEDYGYDDPVEGIKACIKSIVDGYTLLRSSGINETSDIKAMVRLSFSGLNYHLYQLEFNCNSITVDPFDEYDFLQISANYNMIKDEVLITSNPVFGFFNSYSLPNPYGFMTDELYYKEPNIADASVKAFMGSNAGNAKKLFEFKARIKELPTGDNKIGSMILTNSNDLNQDGDEFLVVASSADRLALHWDYDAAKYVFNNPKDFNTNSITKNLAVGDVVEVRLFRDDTYDEGLDETIIRGQGCILSVSSSEEQINDTNPQIPVDYDLWTCQYEHTIIADGSSVIASFDASSSASITITNPRDGLALRSKLTFTSGGKEYTYYSREVIIEQPGFGIKIDGYLNRDAVQRDSEHECEFFMGRFEGLDLDLTKNSRLRVKLEPVRLMDNERGHELFDNPTLPDTGIVGHYYYIPSDHEIALHEAGEDLSNLPAEGSYYVYTEDEGFKSYEMWVFYESMSRYEFNPDFNKTNFSLPYVGKWQFNINDVRFAYKNIVYNYTSRFEGSVCQPLEVVLPHDGGESINLNVEDEINLVLGGKSIDIIPSLSDSEDEVYYFVWKTSRSGVVELLEEDNGKITVEPLRAGLVELTVSVESKYLAKTTKTITVRVMDSIYGASKLVAPEGFHKSGEPLTVKVDIRGITNFSNVDIEWKVLDKKKVEVNSSLYRVNNDASLTLLNPGYDDYTVTAFYEGVEIGSITLEFRYVDLNLFLMGNIWWITLITIASVLLIIILKKMTSRGRTAVQHIDGVYTALATYLSDDKLTKHELKKTKRAITSCLHRCEDINIEASNQYEKAIRYLRKSLNDTKVLFNEWDTVNETDKSVYIERLDKDLYKALNVAKEIETARDLIDEYHFKANKKNFESLEEPKKKKGKDKDEEIK